MKPLFKKITCLIIIAAFTFQSAGFAQVLPVAQPAVYSLPTLKYLSVNSANPFNYFNFLLDKGDAPANLTAEAKKLINYFFLALTLPDSSLWVNLRPDEPGRLTSGELALTDFGRVLLEQDLLLKRDVARYLHPQHPQGRQFWEKLYAAIGKDNLKKQAITTSNRVWIVPDEVVVAETEDGALVTRAALKVMLESEYLTLRDVKQNKEVAVKDETLKLSEALMKEIILPALTREINTHSRYAPLRQIYHSVILAEWYKQKHKNSGNAYALSINQGYTKGLESELPWSKDAIWQDYLKSFQNGEYKLQDTIFGLKRMYFSGGITFSSSPIIGDGMGGKGIVGASAGSPAFPMTVISEEQRISAPPGNLNPVISHANNPVADGERLPLTETEVVLSSAAGSPISLEDLSEEDVLKLYKETAEEKGIIYGSGEIEALFNHCRGVAEIAAKTAEKLGVPADDIKKIRAAALLHDIGKLANYETFFLTNLPNGLSPSEQKVVARHAGESINILKEKGLSIAPIIEQAIKYHNGIEGLGSGDNFIKIIIAADYVNAFLDESRPYHSERRSIEDARGGLESKYGDWLGEEIYQALEDVIKDGKSAASRPNESGGDTNEVSGPAVSSSVKMMYAGEMSFRRFSAADKEGALKEAVGLLQEAARVIEKKIEEAGLKKLFSEIKALWEKSQGQDGEMPSELIAKAGVAYEELLKLYKVAYSDISEKLFSKKIAFSDFAGREMDLGYDLYDKLHKPASYLEPGLLAADKTFLQDSIDKFEAYLELLRDIQAPEEIASDAINAKLGADNLSAFTYTLLAEWRNLFASSEIKEKTEPARDNSVLGEILNNSKKALESKVADLEKYFGKVRLNPNMFAFSGVSYAKVKDHDFPFAKGAEVVLIEDAWYRAMVIYEGDLERPGEIKINNMYVSSRSNNEPLTFINIELISDNFKGKLKEDIHKALFDFKDSGIYRKTRFYESTKKESYIFVPYGFYEEERKLMQDWFNSNVIIRHLFTLPEIKEAISLVSSNDLFFLDLNAEEHHGASAEDRFIHHRGKHAAESKHALGQFAHEIIHRIFRHHAKGSNEALQYLKETYPMLFASILKQDSEEGILCSIMGSLAASQPSVFPYSLVDKGLIKTETVEMLVKYGLLPGVMSPKKLGYNDEYISEQYYELINQSAASPVKEISQGNSYKTASLDEVIKAQIDSCLVVAAFNPRTGERIFAHLLATGHNRILIEGGAGGIKQAKELYFEEMLKGIEGGSWQAAIISSAKAEVRSDYVISTQDIEENLISRKAAAVYKNEDSFASLPKEIVFNKTQVSISYVLSNKKIPLESFDFKSKSMDKGSSASSPVNIEEALNKLKDARNKLGADFFNDIQKSEDMAPLVAKEVALGLGVGGAKGHLANRLIMEFLSIKPSDESLRAYLRDYLSEFQQQGFERFINLVDAEKIIKIKDKLSSSPLASQVPETGGIDLSKIELTLKDEKYVSSLSPADVKVLRAAKYLNEGWDSLSLLYAHEVMLLFKDNIAKDITNRKLLGEIFTRLKAKDLLGPQAAQFMLFIRAQPSPVDKAA